MEMQVPPLFTVHNDDTKSNNNDINETYKLKQVKRKLKLNWQGEDTMRGNVKQRKKET